MVPVVHNPGPVTEPRLAIIRGSASFTYFTTLLTSQVTASNGTGSAAGIMGDLAFGRCSSKFPAHMGAAYLTQRVTHNGFQELIQINLRLKMVSGL